MSSTAPCAATVPVPVPTTHHAHMYSGTARMYSKITPKWAQIGPSSPYHRHHRPSDHNHPTTYVCNGSMCSHRPSAGAHQLPRPHVLRYGPHVLKMTSKWAQIGPSSPYHPHHQPSDHNHPTACLPWPHVQPPPHCRCQPTTMPTCTPVQPVCTHNSPGSC